MRVDLFDQWGFAGFDYSYIFISLIVFNLILLIFIIVLIVQLNKLKKQYIKFMTGKDAKTLEESVEKIFEDNQYLKILAEENKKHIRKINKELEYPINKVGIVRYNAFEQMGGFLSFALALVNERQNGFIINTVHSIEGSYVYLKDIQSGLCENELSKEEKEALAKALKDDHKDTF